MKDNNDNVSNDEIVSFPANTNDAKPQKANSATEFPKNCEIINFKDKKKIIDTMEEERRDDLIKQLDKLRNQIADGKMDDVVIVARNVENGLFFTEMSLRKDTYNSPLIGTIGSILNALSWECDDVVTMAPYTDLDGNIYDPKDEEY